MSALTFLGLIERSGNLAIGVESCTAAARSGKARLILTASDAGAGAASKVSAIIRTYGVAGVSLPCTKAELGAAAGRGQSGIMAVLDVGMAAALAEKLEQEFPGACGGALEILRAAAEKAAQRRHEAARHKQNLRRGKRGHSK